MKLKFQYITIIIILLGIITACQAGTFKPFIRSRYSIRWRKTTEAPKLWDTSTSGPLREEMDKSSTKSIEESDTIQTANNTKLTTIATIIKTSTHSPDYDYYNNELEEVEHKN